MVRWIGGAGRRAGRIAATVLLLAGAWPGLAGRAAEAGELKLSTIQIDLNDRQSSAALTISNVGTTRSLLQLRLASWTQTGNTDRYEPTTDLVINPPIAEIPGAGRQLIRIGFIGTRQTIVERAYRLFIEEVPIAGADKPEGVQTLLKISLPVFVAPLVPPQGALVAALSSGSAARALVLVNGSTRHVRFSSVTLVGRDGTEGPKHAGPRYVLANGRMAFVLDQGDLAVVAPDRVRLVADSGPLELPLAAAVPPETP